MSNAEDNTPLGIILSTISGLKDNAEAQHKKHEELVKKHKKLERKVSLLHDKLINLRNDIAYDKDIM